MGNKIDDSNLCVFFKGQLLASHDLYTKKAASNKR